MAQLKRTAKAVWHGTGKDGDGTLSTQSATLNNVPYSFLARFGDGKGTNPEELIAAAHAGCFSMQLAFLLAGNNTPAAEINTGAVLIMESDGPAWKIATVELSLQASVPGISAEKFTEIAAIAKANCPVSKVLNAEVKLTAKLL